MNDIPLTKVFEIYSQEIKKWQTKYRSMHAEATVWSVDKLPRKLWLTEIQRLFDDEA